MSVGKSIMPTLLGAQGTGKGTILKEITKMMGSNKVFETGNPGRDVWGQLNGLLKDC